jgi:hypothetical protein
MILSIITVIWFAIAYAIKGGQGKSFFRNFKKVRDSHPILERLLDGKVLSTLMVLIWACFVTVWTQSNIGGMDTAELSVVAITLAWLLSVAPSMGEEYGAIRNDKTSPYLLYFDREYGIKKAIQRGVFIGACMALATGSLLFIVSAALLFVPLAWLALHYAPAKIFDRWGWSEILIGGFVYGLPMAFLI